MWDIQVRHFMLGDTEHNKGLRADGYQLTLRNMAVRNGFANGELRCFLLIMKSLSHAKVE